MGHSLGGVIAYEYCQLGNHKVDRLVTVGSQVGLLAEMGAIDAPSGGNGKFAMPARTTTWLNLYDPSDVLSFLAAPVFAGVVDMGSSQARRSRPRTASTGSSSRSTSPLQGCLTATSPS